MLPLPVTPDHGEIELKLQQLQADDDTVLLAESGEGLDKIVSRPVGR